MKLTALSIALIAALGMTSGCSTQTSKQSLAASPASVDAEAQYALGRYYQGQQRYELAIEAYRKALSANPAHVSAHNGLGASLLLVGQNTQAIEQFKTGLIHQPRSAALWNNLGYAYMLTGESKLAEIALRQALDLDPADSKTTTNLAMAQEKSAQPVAAPPVIAVATPPAATVAAPPTIAVATPTVVALTATPVLAAVAPLQAAEPTKNAPAPVAQLETAKPALAPVVVAAGEVAQAVPASVRAAPATVQVVEVAPRIFELNIPETTAASTQVAFTSLAMLPINAGSATTISVPLHDENIEPAMPALAQSDKPQTEAGLTQVAQADKTQLAAINNEDFKLEIRNGNGVRFMALRTSQYLAHQGYSTRRLTNQPGFNVATTRIFYLPGYLAEAERLLAHLPRNTTMSESQDLRHGTHVRVVLGRDMARQRIGLYQVAPMYAMSAPVYMAAPVYVAALTR